MKRRFLATLLALCMALAILPPGTVLAAELEPDEEEGGIMPLTVVDDHTPPEVTGIYMNSPGGTVVPGDKLEFSVSAEDESGIEMWGSGLRFTYVNRPDTIIVDGEALHPGSVDFFRLMDFDVLHQPVQHPACELFGPRVLVDSRHEYIIRFRMARKAICFCSTVKTTGAKGQPSFRPALF